MLKPFSEFFNSLNVFFSSRVYLYSCCLFNEILILFLISLVVYLCPLFSSLCISLGQLPLPLLGPGIVERKAFTDQLRVRFQDLSNLLLRMCCHWACAGAFSCLILPEQLVPVSFQNLSSVAPPDICLWNYSSNVQWLQVHKMWLHLFSVAYKQGCQSYQWFESSETETSPSGNAQSNHDIECMVHSCFCPEGRSSVWEVSSMLSSSKSDSAGIDGYTKLHIFLFLLLGSLVVVSGCCNSPLVSYILAKIFWLT